MIQRHKQVGRKKDANSSHKRAGIAILLSDKIDFKEKTLLEKKRYFPNEYLWPVHLEYRKIIDFYAPTKSSNKHEAIID